MSRQTCPSSLDWREDLLMRLGRELVRYLLVSRARPGRIHLAVLVEPYLSELLDGRKTVESRFTCTRKPPYESAAAGDVVLLKRSSGPIVGVCTIARTQFFEITPAALRAARRSHATAIGNESNAFWRAQSRKRYASLLHIEHVQALPETRCAKRDPTGWVILRNARAGRAGSD